MQYPDIWFPHLGIEIEKLSRVAISNLFGIGLDIYWYGVIIGTAVLTAYILALHEAKRTKQSIDFYMDFVIWAIFVCVVGARLYYVIFDWQLYRDNLLSIFNLRQGGLAIYGAVLAAIAFSYYYTRRKKVDFWLFADTGAPSLLLGQVFGRWGNFFNREAFGGYTDSLFAMRLRTDQVRSGDLTPDIIDHIIKIPVEGTGRFIEYIQVHPTFLYESTWNLCLFIVLFILQRKKKFHGQVFSLYMIGYGIGRFWIEGLRTDQLLFWGTGIAVSQIVSIGIIAAGIAVFVLRQRTGKQAAEEAGK